jgi:Glycosyl hydrolase family 9
VAGEMAAALAHAAVAFKDEPELRDAYWEKAKSAYEQTGVATGNFGTSSDEYALLKTFYASSGTISHVFFAAASMYTACRALGCPDETAYLEDANGLGIRTEASGEAKYGWEVPGWDNAWWDGAMLMAQAGQPGPLVEGQPAYTMFLDGLADKWTNGKAPVQYAPSRGPF